MKLTNPNEANTKNSTKHAAKVCGLAVAGMLAVNGVFCVPMASALTSNETNIKNSASNVAIVNNLKNISGKDANLKYTHGEFVHDIKEEHTKQIQLKKERIKQYNRNMAIKQEQIRKKKEQEKMKKLSSQNTQIHSLTPVWLKPTNGSSAKPYESYRAITDPSSKQYRFQMQPNVREDSRGFLMEDGTWYCVAMGTYFGDIGTKYIITLSSGRTINVVKGDNKADCDTDADNYLAQGGHIIEFMINPNAYYTIANGVISRGNLNILPELNGSITSIQRVN